ncbi:MAG: carboxypeptidase regulatory-like domain-containing protein [Inhella sp.]|jgi:M6 family metalloprotease-like protein|uniref:carboxypeptidase regulatory-like domain-containing protein n=1 Tax=Inhella sp. TaxID=1921806 RepID=UPI0022C128D5|nr:carboxypeptidase regulatory-like domain-containing protein [Inhella sp.]MCZ8235884.1 carboxypeptidase regulatory-like domain-containing protein [Inhella sp.]
MKPRLSRLLKGALQSVFLLLAVVTHAHASSVSGRVLDAQSNPIANAKVGLKASAATGQLYGRVVDANKNPIVGAQVFVDVMPEVSGQSPHISVTDGNGQYQLSDVPAGTVTLGMWKRGYETQYQMNVSVYAGALTQQDLSSRAVTVSEDHVVLLRAEFQNMKFHPDHTAAWADQLFFDDTPGRASVRNFYYQLSHGRLDLRKGANVLVQVTDPALQYPHDDSKRDDIVDYVIRASKGLVNYADPKLDRSASWDHAPGADGKIDHLVVLTAGMPKSITGSSCDMNPVSMINTEYVTSTIKSPVQALLAEYSPLGNIVHEMFHSMGETAVQDLYIGGSCDSTNELATDLTTLGKWEAMDIGMYNLLREGFTDPRGSSCTAGYKDPCAGQSGNCLAAKFGGQPALPGTWTLSKWYHKKFWDDGVIQRITVGNGKAQTIRLYPYSTSGNGAQAIIVPRASNSSQWWTITNRQPIGTDRGLVFANTAGQKGIVIDFNDAALAGRMALKGPSRVRDSHPGTVPSYAHYSCRAAADDAAFNVGEVSTYTENELDVRLIQEHPDGSISLRVGNGVSAQSNVSQTAASAPKPGVQSTREATASGRKAGPSQADSMGASLRLDITPSQSARPANTSFNATKGRLNKAYSATSAGDFLFEDVAAGDYTLTADACGYSQGVAPIKVDGVGHVSRDLVLLANPARKLAAVVSSPANQARFSAGQTILLSAVGSSVFGEASYEWRSDRDGLLATSSTASVTLTLGVHNLTLLLKNELCTTQASVTVNVEAASVNLPPLASFTTSQSDLTLNVTSTSSDPDGTIVAYQYQFGDGSTASSPNAARTYPSAGTYTVTLKVTDDRGSTAVSSKQVTMQASDPGRLQSGVSKPFSLAEKAEMVFNIDVPAGQTQLTINVSAATGDPDLYVKRGAVPTRAFGGSDFKSTKTGTSETISIQNPAAGKFYILVYAFRAIGGGAVSATYK